MRVERDALGERPVPDDVYWGINTERSIENFPISGITYPPEMPRAIGAVKLAAAQANIELGALDPEIGKLIIQAACELTGLPLVPAGNLFEITQSTADFSLVSSALRLFALELNIMLPLVAHNLLRSIRILSRASRVLSERCIEGITANRETAERYAGASGAVVTALSPYIGYLPAAEIVKESLQSKRSIREIALERELMEEEKLDQLLDPQAMTGQRSER